MTIQTTNFLYLAKIASFLVDLDSASVCVFCYHSCLEMGRPKASERNKTIASLFADAVTVHIQKESEFSHQRQKVYSPVACKGPHSIFQALLTCLPTVVRESRGREVKNRTGLSEAELHKVLISRGYEKCRRRVRCESICVWLGEWGHRRWIDFNNDDDSIHVQRGIESLNRFPEASLLTLDIVVETLSAMTTDPNRFSKSILYARTSHTTNFFSTPIAVPELKQDKKISCKLRGRHLFAVQENSYQTHDIPRTETQNSLHDQGESLQALTAPFDASHASSATTAVDPGDPIAALLLRLAGLGWDCPALRRLCSFGYHPAHVARLLDCLPPSPPLALLNRAAAAAPLAGSESGGWPGPVEGGAGGGEAGRVFGAAEARMRRAMEEDGETGFLEADYDAETQCRTRVFLNDRYAALRGAESQTGTDAAGPGPRRAPA